MIMLFLIINSSPAIESFLPYTIVDTGQDKCYDTTGEITAPLPGQPFYGQDAQHKGKQPSYKLSADGLTVHDNITDLTWQRNPDINRDSTLDSNDKKTLAQAQELPAKLNAAKFGGFSDWRLPTIKELYSLTVFSGIDPRPGSDTSQLTPFIDTKYFKFAYGDQRAGERIIDSQWASSTLYAANSNQMFGVNFADGRIKGYPTTMPGRPNKTFFVICVRGNPQYGKNDFHNNDDGTITDHATGLMWAKADSGKGMNWEAALAWVQTMNNKRFLGHIDWRLPNAKELQSIVDYTRAPAATHSPAINPMFQTTKLDDGEFPFFWTSTTHQGGPHNQQGGAAVYLAFGRATGWMKRGGSDAYRLLDVHGAGAQRSDQKTGDPTAFPHGRGPQGDVIRIYNYVRLVRGGLN